MNDSKSKLRLAPLMLATLGASLAFAGQSRAQALVEAREVPTWATPAAKVGSANDSQRVSIAVFLGFRNESALRELIADVSTPSSAHYGRYLTPAQFHAQFSPAAADVQRVQRALTKLGFRVDYTPASGLFVEVSGTVAQVKSAFGVTQDLYAYRGKTLRANAETPRVPAEIADIVKVVAGLDESAVLRTSHHISLDEPAGAAKLAAAAAASASPNAPPPVQTGIPSPVCSTFFNDHTGTLSTPVAPYPATLPWLICGYTPQQLRAAYGSTFVRESGAGVTVGIVDIYGSPTIVADANRYSKNHGLPQLITGKNFFQILPANIYNVPASDPCGPQGWYEEESLDVESVHSMAPGADIVFAGDVCTDPANAPLYSLIDEHTVDIVTNSYGYNGENVPGWFITVETFYFEQAASEGISVLFSTGDSGDLAAINGIASGSWDATSPWVTAVGGTSLALLSWTGEKLEWGWGTYRVVLNGATVPANGKEITDSGPALPFTFYAGSGGGPSLIELAPPYQADVPPSLSMYTTLENGKRVPLHAAYRVDPDISMVGDPYTGFLYGETFTKLNPPDLDHNCVNVSTTTEYCEGSLGGTSLSSPLFAGVLALVNQARFKIGKGAVGFVNPALYAIAAAGGGGPGSAIVDVKPPKSPTAVLRGYTTNSHLLRVVTMNSTLDAKGNIIEGADTSYRTTPGYDDVTGLGTPWVPSLIEALLFY